LTAGVQTDDTYDETEVSATASVWLILCASLVCIICRAVERGCKNLGFYFFSPKNLKNRKSPDFTFLGFLRKKTLKIRILDSQSQQKIVALQSN